MIWLRGDFWTWRMSADPDHSSAQAYALVSERFQRTSATAKKWADRYRFRGEADMADLSSRQRRSPNRTCLRTERRIVALRFTRRWGPHRIACTMRSMTTPAWRARRPSRM
jgi:transposase